MATNGPLQFLSLVILIVTVSAVSGPLAFSDFSAFNMINPILSDLWSHTQFTKHSGKHAFC